MKKIFVLLFAIAMIFSCKNVDQYKAGITELSTKWDAATKTFNDINTMVAAAKAAHTSALDSLKIDEAFMSKLKGSDLDKVKSAVQAYNASGAGITDAVGKLAEIKTNWEAKSGEVKALTDGLASGKLEGDVTAKIAELTSFISSNENALNAIKETVNSSSANSTSTLEALKKVVAPLMKKK